MSELGVNKDMILYKYKSLEKFDEVSDLLLTKRLYCPTPSQLNDPLEGVLGIDINEDLRRLEFNDKLTKEYKYWRILKERINNYRVCSFSEDPSSILMWSYYGAGHSGMCLELDMTEYNDNIHKVSYVHKIEVHNAPSPIHLLTHKLGAWSHEKEYRWVSDENLKFKFLKANIQTVLLGASIDIKLFRPVFEMCAIMNIQIDIASFNTSGEFTRFPLKKGIRWDETMGIVWSGQLR
jgi:hypothetical protein